VPAALGDGLQLAVGYNPLVALVGAIVAAVIMSRSTAPAPTLIGWSVLAGFWWFGDGVLILQALGSEVGAWVALGAPALVGAAIWAVGGFALGYALPAWAGSFVGQRVTWGTGWASAGVFAAMVSGLVATLTGAIG
jgi:hypothetical protein